MAKKTFNKKMWVSLFIIAIMVLSAFGFMFSYQTGQSEKLADYNGYKFIKTTQGVQTQINKEKVHFQYYPGDLEQINISDEAKATLTEAKAIYLTYDPESAFAPSIAELELDLEQKSQQTGKIYIARGLTNTTGYALPEITCKNATPEMPVLLIQKGEKSKITASNNCITLTAEAESTLNAFYARITYTILGVMK